MSAAGRRRSVGVDVGGVTVGGGAAEGAEPTRVVETRDYL